MDDLVQQFQAAARNLNSDEQKQIEEVKLELLKMRNLPSLDAIIEQNGESGTHTFDRDLGDLLNP